jgi:hypothetical protein
MTDEELKKDAMTFSYGFEKGQTHERYQIVAWLRANQKGNVDPWSKAADAIEAGDYLK